MTEGKRKPKAGGPRSEVFAMRLDPKMKYLAEIAARKQRRSLANFMEWAIELALRNTYLGPETENAPSIWDKSGALWDVNEADRFVKLVFTAPDLMTYDEEILWKSIREGAPYWKGCYDLNGDWIVSNHEERDLNPEHLRRNWDLLKRIAAGQTDGDVLLKSASDQPGNSNTPS